MLRSHCRGVCALPSPSRGIYAADLSVGTNLIRGNGPDIAFDAWPRPSSVIDSVQARLLVRSECRR